VNLRERLKELGWDGKALLTPNQVAALLEVGRPAVEDLTRRGLLRVVRMGKKSYITLASLEELVEGAVPRRRAVWLTLRLLERLGARVELATHPEGYTARALGEEGRGLTPEEAVLALADRLAGEVEREGGDL
jgi:excisionase family DNA binding protein